MKAAPAPDRGGTRARPYQRLYRRLNGTGPPAPDLEGRGAPARKACHVAGRPAYDRRAMPAQTPDPLGALLTESALWVGLIAVFVLLLGYHLLDARRRAVRARAIRAAGEYGPRSAAVIGILEGAGRLSPAEIARLGDAHRRAVGRDPRMDRDPADFRRLRDRAYGNERDVVALAAAGAAADAIRAAAGAATVAPPDVQDAALAAGDAAGATVAADRLELEEVRLLTRAWREVVGPVGAVPRAGR